MSEPDERENGGMAAWERTRERERLRGMRQAQQTRPTDNNAKLAGKLVVASANSHSLDYFTTLSFSLSHSLAAPWQHSQPLSHCRCHFIFARHSPMRTHAHAHPLDCTRLLSLYLYLSLSFFFSRWDFWDSRVKSKFDEWQFGVVAFSQNVE